MRLRALLALVLIVTVCSGCIAAQARWKTSEDLPRIPSGEPIPVYLASTAPDWVRKELAAHTMSDPAPAWGAQPVAEIEAKAGWLASYGTMVDGVRDTARAMGADTIVVSATADYDPARVVFFRLMRRAPAFDR